MRQIFIEHEIQYRLLQFLIFLFTEFGIIQQQYIYLPFYIKHKELAIILDSNIITINKIINIFHQKLLIGYNTKNHIYITNIYIFRYYSYLLR